MKNFRYTDIRVVDPKTNAVIGRLPDTTRLVPNDVSGYDGMLRLARLTFPTATRILYTETWVDAEGRAIPRAVPLRMTRRTIEAPVRS